MSGRCRPTVRQHDTYKIGLLTEAKKGLTSKLHSSVDFPYSFSTVHQVCHTASLSPAPLRSLIGALLLCTSPLISAFAALACTSTFPSALDQSGPSVSAAVRRSCEASPRYGRRRSGSSRFIANEHGLALPTTRGRTKRLAMHVLSGPWCRTQQQRALRRMNEVVDSMPRLPCLCGMLRHKGTLNTPSLSVVLEIQKQKSVFFFFFLKLAQRKGCFNLSAHSHKKKVVSFPVNAKQRGYFACYDFKVYYRRPPRNSPFLFLTVL